MKRTNRLSKDKLDPGHRRLLWVLPCLIVFSATVNHILQHGLDAGPMKRNPNGASMRHPLEITDGIPDCIPASIEDFPDDFFTNEQRLEGGVVLHFLLTIYFCAMLAIICDDYFVPALEVIADNTKIPTDVAGATFMAIGTSSPELFSSIIGSFVTEGDIGIGTIVGSAVFNILGVASMAGIVVGTKNVPVDWYPITRDCSIYAITVAALIAVMNDNVVYWWESLIMLIMYVGYIAIMYFNTRIEGISTNQVNNIKEWWKSKNGKELDERTPLLGHQGFCPEVITESVKSPSKGPVLTTDDEISVEDDIAGKRSRRESQIVTDNVKELEEREYEEGSLCSMPYGNAGKQIWWIVMWPATLLFTLTVPDCRRPSWRKFFPLTFIMSVIWLGILSYMTIWMVTIIAYTLGIPDTVAGITFLAAGTSIPEIMSSIIVVRNGLGNMAICNLLGSNIFDILFCLGAPWLVKTAGFSNGDGFLLINSSALTYTTATLLTTVVMLYAALTIANWQLNWKLGIVCLVLYILFLVLACMYEMNVFGDFNPPPCPR